MKNIFGGMKLHCALCCISLWALCAGDFICGALASEAPAIAKLSIGPAVSSGLKIAGPDSRLQLLITGVDQASHALDLTRSAQYSAAPIGIVHVDDSGLVTPLADGQVTITASSGEQTATVEITVEDFAATRPVDFQNQIIPLFTKLGCNGGGCHGKSSGQNGFKLSLLGFYPEDDYEYLVKEGRGRRIFPAAPEKSLLLTKPVGDVAHGGGKRMDKDSQEYRTLRRWIEQGCPRSDDETPVVARIECIPPDGLLHPHESQQIAVYATYSDGTREDVTRMTIFEPNDLELAESTATGLVTAHELSGEVAVMARYQGQVSTFRATIPLQATVTDLPPIRNVVDETVFKKLQKLGIPPSPVCDDATFVRRVTVDITGRLPTETQVRDFIANADPEKRNRLIDALLDSPEYADCFANKWNMILRNKRRQDLDRDGTYEFHQWIWDSLYENKPYDQFVKEIITASGDPQWNPPVVWYREVAEVEQQAEDTAQLFLGVRIQCARCHHHPYERWSQDDYYGLAAFFSRVGRKELGAEVARNSRDRRIYHNDGIAELPHPRTRENLKPVALGGPELNIPAERDPRFYLASWLAEPDNAFFARCLVNRYWKHFFNRGIVEPEDDMRETNPPCNPELLDGLSRSFVESGYDLKGLVRLICQSSTYQLSSDPNEFNARDKQNFSRYYPKRLPAESLYDAFHQVTGTTQSYAGMPAGSRALQLPDVSVGPYFLKVFGQPQADSACECERSQSANLAQSLHLLNSQEVQSKIGSPTGRAHQLAQETGRTHAERLTELYYWVFARAPDEQELQTGLTYLEKHKDNLNVAYEDIVWALINTKEFLFNH
ncbi:DUF1549 domain-containing protein [Planctomicrobium piriforme]|uniref:Ig-like domain (Group 2) n=1 Tax=Planctomicrobium piriforme TaxID=1576369 RepID=A0A1I3FBH0_9PLAN|nr:DUF1549 domain-containing protein [Planctomicrobium piriforme]SFI08221.1 Protein of unknown function [Planctomicrobium piriforme]